VSCHGQEALVCHEGTQAVSTTCEGPDGCSAAGNRLSCGSPVATVGAPCDAEGDVSEACTSDGTALLACSSGVWVVSTMCRGPSHCERAFTFCDEHVGIVGEPCSASEACTQEHDRVHCTEGRWQLREHCRGPSGCSFVEDQLVCDNRIASEGDACEEGRGCSLDGASELHCIDGRMVLDTRCPGPHHCWMWDGLVTCDGAEPIDGGVSP
jgi:hypothetical protein